MCVLMKLIAGILNTIFCNLQEIFFTYSDVSAFWVKNGGLVCGSRNSALNMQITCTVSAKIRFNEINPGN